MYFSIVDSACSEGGVMMKINKCLSAGLARKPISVKNANYIAWNVPGSSGEEAFDGKLVEWMEKVTDEEYLAGPDIE